MSPQETKKRGRSQGQGRSTSKIKGRKGANHTKTSEAVIRGARAASVAEGIHRMSRENQLGQIPRRPSGSTKIWFMYDYVDPAAKFRMMPLDYDWNNKEDFVGAGEDEYALVDDHEHQKTIPVFVEGYQ
jgi:hypothetical protein